MLDYDNIRVEEINVEARLGSLLSECLIDAMKMCLDSRESVTLQHNGKIYTVILGDLMDSIQVCK